jgi:ubiquinol-cytochrome c reductase cytochrome b subunit
VVRPNAKGRIPWTQNLRSSMSRWFFEDRLSPLTQTEVAAADAHQRHVLHDTDEAAHEEIVASHQRAGVSEDQIVPVDTTHVGETPNTPSSALARESLPQKQDGE